MTCQDCIHHNVCYYAGRLKTKDSDGEKRIIAETNNVEDTCEDFQDRSLYVKLPCKEGDSLFMLNRDKTKVQEMIFEKPDIRCHCKKDDEFVCCMPVCTSYQNGICAYRFNNDFREIDKTVFLAREEAERVLKERESNEQKNS